MFAFEERLGMYFTVQSASLSAAAITGLLCYTLFRWLRAMTDRRYRRTLYDACDSSLFLTLMVAELIRAIGNIISVRWMMDGEVRDGVLCTGQGIIKLIGTNAVSFASLAIAIQTFLVLIVRWRGPEHTSKFFALSVWIIVALIVGTTTGIRKLALYGPAGYWCWIILKYKNEQIMAEYLWMWAAGAIMVILYVIMFLVMRGYMIIENGRMCWYKKHERVKLDLTETETEGEKEARLIANMLLFYPAVYVICVFPFSLSRWLFFGGHDVPHQFSLFTNALFSASGLFNVILFYYTRPELVTGPSNPSHLHLASASSQARPRQLSTDDVHPHSREYGHLPSQRNRNKEREDIEKAYVPTANGGREILYKSEVTKSIPSPSTPSSSGRSRGDSEYVFLVASKGKNLRDNTRIRRDHSTSVEEEEDYGRLPG